MDATPLFMSPLAKYSKTMFCHHLINMQLTLIP